jgi:hypothetical protein
VIKFRAHQMVQGNLLMSESLFSTVCVSPNSWVEVLISSVMGSTHARPHLPSFYTVLNGT